MSVAEKKRVASIELLRILAMVMVVTMHFLRESGSLLSSEQSSVADMTTLLGTLLESFCIAAVNAYVFISGYFGCKSEFKISRVLLFMGQIWFYALLIPMVLAGFGNTVLGKEMGIYGFVQYVLPIESESYWFATSYLLLMLLQPLLNVAVKYLAKKQLEMTLLGLFLILGGVKSICPIALATDRYGYDLPWFVFLYLLASYLSVYGMEFIKRHGWKIYMGSSLVIFSMTAGLWYVLRYFPKAAYYSTVPFHYNFIFCLTAALGLCGGFLKMKWKEGKGAEIIRKLGKCSFGIYLLHEHPDIRHIWYPFLRKIVNPEGRHGTGMFLAELVFCIAILFAAGIFIEWIRIFLFELIGRWGRRAYADSK